MGPSSWGFAGLGLKVLGFSKGVSGVVVKIRVPFWGPYYNTAPII